MQGSSVVRFSVKLCLASAVLVYSLTLALAENDRPQSLISAEGLYNASDNVVILNVTNFKSTVFGDRRGWLVEFYNSWCGFCFRFAPIWKALATDVYGWRDIVAIAAVDCADDDNNPICREYEVMYYPMIKYFPVNAHPSLLGTVMQKKDSTVESLRYSLVKMLEKEQQEGRGSTWPNITPYRNIGTRDIWKAVPSTVKYFFLLFEDANSALGSEVILDLYKIPSLQIRRVTSDNELLCVMNKVTRFPSLVVFGRNETQRMLNIRIPMREGVRQTIKDFMVSKGIEIDEQFITPSPIEIISKAVHASTEKQHGSTVEQVASEISVDHLYQLDLENTLRYSLSHEIPLSKSIEGEKMIALKTYLNILAKYFPLRYNGMFLEVIRDIINKKETVSGEEFSQLVRSTEEELGPVYSGPQQWIGCKGSSETYRGYPCGLWTMFHMLTVNSAAQNSNNSQYEATEVLRAMYGYIKNFFGCVDCANHFVQMASKNKMYDVSSGEESVMWLWKAHNEVNARLAGDQTEDPKHKKIQYPSVEHCPTCRLENNSWNEEQVLFYLKKKYSYVGIDYQGSKERSQTANNRSKIRQERLVTSKYSSLKKLGWDFTIFDISICVILYVLSTSILVLVCIKFAVKRSYRKKGYINLLGKV